MPVLVKTALLLVVSNVFMTFAWYAHLKELNHRPWLIAALVSWGVVPFAVFYLREPIKLDYLWAGLCLCGAVWFMFRGGLGPRRLRADRRFANLRAVRALFALVLLSTAVVGCADAQTPDGAGAATDAGATVAATADTIVIADGSVFGEATDLSDWSTRAPMQAAFASARAHWQAQDPSYEEEVIVMAVAEGAFSEPGASQQAVLYLMSLWPRCCPKMGIAVVQDGTLVRNVGFEDPAQSLAAIPDLDGDGLDELAVTGSFGMGGENSSSVTLVSLADSGFRTWGGAMIRYDACGAMQEGGEASRITAVPGPAFTIERFSLVSCETGEFEAGGPPEPFEFPAPGEETSVELPVR